MNYEFCLGISKTMRSLSLSSLSLLQVFSGSLGFSVNTEERVKRKTKKTNCISEIETQTADICPHIVVRIFKTNG